MYIDIDELDLFNMSPETTVELCRLFLHPVYIYIFNKPRGRNYKLNNLSVYLIVKSTKSCQIFGRHTEVDGTTGSIPS